jgi:hypothetical protein
MASDVVCVTHAGTLSCLREPAATIYVLTSSDFA